MEYAIFFAFDRLRVLLVECHEHQEVSNELEERQKEGLKEK